MKFITILLCKILAFVGKMIGKGSSLPGKFALKLCPDILTRLPALSEWMENGKMTASDAA